MSGHLAVPPLYRKEFYAPYVATLDRLGPQDFSTILVRDPQRERSRTAA